MLLLLHIGTYLLEYNKTPENVSEVEWLAMEVTY